MKKQLKRGCITINNRTFVPTNEYIYCTECSFDEFCDGREVCKIFGEDVGGLVEVFSNVVKNDFNRETKKKSVKKWPRIQKTPENHFIKKT